MHPKRFFITGIGTGIGKTIASAIITEALEADYWKPIQAGLPADSDAVRDLLSNNKSVVHPEKYVLTMPASPHIAAKEEGIKITSEDILKALPQTENHLIIEGAGGLMVPVNDEEFIIDVIKKLQAQVIIVSRNYLGSINHSLLTAAILKQQNIAVAGWIFNDQYLNYEEDIVNWSGFEKIASIEKSETINKQTIKQQAERISSNLKKLL